MANEITSDCLDKALCHPSLLFACIYVDELVGVKYSGFSESVQNLILGVQCILKSSKI